MTKSFGGVHALRGVSLEMYPGEIGALIGENGAGKSTLIKIISGAYAPDGGRLFIDEEARTFRSPHDAAAAGIAVVHQETSLTPDLSVLENLYLGRWQGNSMHIAWRRMRREASDLFTRLGMTIPLTARLGSLPKAAAQQVEIARAMLQGARILLLDEPGSVLNYSELKSLHDLLIESRNRGAAVLYISHRLEEVFRISDRITVFRDGRNVRTDLAAEVEPGAVIRAMVGRDVDSLYVRSDVPPGPEVLTVENLSGPDFESVNLTVRRGEIVGMAGLVGSGRSEVAQAIAGLYKATSGRVTLNGRAMPKRPWSRQRAGVGYLTGDRSGRGSFAVRTVASNITLTTLDRYSRFLALRRRAQFAAAQEAVAAYNIRPPKADLLIRNLSGGNQQKAMIARALARDPSLLILEEPTSGVDIGSKEEVHRVVNQMTANGVGILLVSSDLEELLGMSDRILVMREGRIAGELPRGADAESVMRLALATGEASQVAH